VHTLAEARALQPDELRHVLQLAAAVPHAGRAVLVVIAEQELDLQALLLAHDGRAGQHLHARLHRRVAAGHDVGFVSFAPDLDEADAARTGSVVDIRELTESRHEVPGALGDREDALVLLELHGLAVDRGLVSQGVVAGRCHLAGHRSCLYFSVTTV
jgi:hypothetical protein